MLDACASIAVPSRPDTDGSAEILGKPDYAQYTYYFMSGF